MRKSTVAIVTAVVTTAGLIVGCVGPKSASSEVDAFDKELMEAADSINRSLPMMADSETRVDSVIVMPGKTMKYHFTLVNYAKSEIDIVALQEALAPVSLNIIKTDPSLQGFRDNEVTIVYSYRDNTGVFLFELEFGPEDYAD